MWHDHSFNQRNRTTGRAVGVELDKIGKRGGGVGNIGGSSHNSGVNTLLPTMKKKT